MMASSTSLTNIFEGMQSHLFGGHANFGVTNPSAGPRMNLSTCDLSQVIAGGGIRGASSTNILAHGQMGNSGAISST